MLGVGQEFTGHSSPSTGTFLGGGSNLKNMEETFTTGT